MRRLFLLAGLLAWGTAAHASPAWDTLWHTDEQRGQQLLREGRPADAARLFRDPRRRAYAELQAGNFARAAQDLAGFDDSDSQYNRGNALARAGHLQEAIAAYDAALARDPRNRDARHNRDVVARALQQQKPSPAPQQEKQGGSAHAEQSGQSGQSGQNNGTAQNSGAAKSQPGQAQSQAAASQLAQPQQAQQQARGSEAQPAGRGPSQAGAQAAAGQPGGDLKRAQQAASEAAQARSDAEAALGQRQPGQTTAPADESLSERQLAEAQWLRRIPDDPGGLLRRKFLIEHMIRQQGTQR